MSDGLLWSTYFGSGSPYAVIFRQSDGKVWDGSAFSTYANGSITTYAGNGALTNRGGDYWSADFPSGIAAGTVCSVVIYDNTGTAAITDVALKNYTATAGTSAAAGSASGEDLLTLAEMKTFLNLSTTTYDSLLTALITAASYALLKYCEKDSFKLATYSGTILNGNGQRYMVLPNWPVTSISSIIVDYNETVPTTFAGSMFDVEGATGEFRFKPTATYAGRIACRGFQNVSASYIAGLSSIPADLKLCGQLFIKRLYQQTTVNTTLKSETIGDYKNENFQRLTAQLGGDPMFDDLRTMLAAGGYYRPHVYLY